MSIYTLPQEVSQAMDKYYSLFDMETWELLGSEEELTLAQSTLDELANKSWETTEWYLKDRANKLAYIAWIESEIDRLSKVASQEKKKVARSENLLERIFSKIYEGKAMVIWSFKLSYRSSEAVLIENEAGIPKEFLRIIPAVAESTAPDKIAIKKAINEGIEVPGATIETRQSFQIK